MIHRMASITLLFPQPFGPTRAVIPGLKFNIAGSTKDLNPESSSFFIFMAKSSSSFYIIAI
jgi:hypothetical protein